MAVFLATACGKSGDTVTRQGSGRSGIHLKASSWQGVVDVQMIREPTSGLDLVRITASLGGNVRVLYDGPVAGLLGCIPLHLPEDAQCGS